MRSLVLFMCVRFIKQYAQTVGVDSEALLAELSR